MARGRTRKPRLSRMDAAVDAMVPFGFPEEKVRKCVKELLKVYGGDAGWPFVEEYAYKELIEAMLRDEEQVGEDCDELKLYTNYRFNICGSYVSNKLIQKEKLIEDGSGAGTSTRVSERQQDEGPENNSEPNIVGSLDAISEPKSTDIISTLSLTYYADKTGRKENECGPKTHVPSRSLIPSSQQLNCSTTHTLQPSNNGAPHRRQPCYGWIDSDDEDIDDFVFLEPANAAVGAILPQEISKVQSDGTKTHARRRSRWDVRPDDP